MPDELASTETGLAMASGTVSEGQTWVGRSFGPRACEDEVTWPAIRHFCALVGDANRLYWDEEYAVARFGAVPAPPGMLFVWAMPPVWRPDGVRHPPTMATEVPLPGNTLINVETLSEFLAPILVGARLTVEETVAGVSAEKATALGVGSFVTTDAVFRTAEGIVARQRNVLYRYAATAGPPTPRRSTPDAPRTAGEVLPEVVVPVTLRLCVHDAAATRDYFPGHHDRDYAQAQNARDTYLNTMYFHGLVDRVVTDWTGPGGTIISRRLRMMAPVCIGDVIRTHAVVVEHRPDPETGGQVVDVTVDVRSEHGTGASALVSCRIPNGIA